MHALRDASSQFEPTIDNTSIDGERSPMPWMWLLARCGQSRESFRRSTDRLSKIRRSGSHRHPHQRSQSAFSSSSLGTHISSNINSSTLHTSTHKTEQQIKVSAPTKRSNSSMSSSSPPPPLHRRDSSKSSYAHDFWKHFQQRPLDAVFRPKSVALIGASEKEGSVGKTILWNLLTSPFGGTIYPVNNNPRKLKGNVFGIRSYQRMQDIPEQGIDLAIIAVPSKAVKDVSRIYLV